MKKLVILTIIASAALLPMTIMAQQKTVIDDIYNKYAGKDGFTSINISPDMFQMLASMNMGDSSKDAKEAQNAIKQLKGMKMLVYEPKDSNQVFDFYKELKNKIPSNKFKEIMTVDAQDGKVRFLVNQNKNGKIKEFLMFVSGKHESLVMSLSGSIDMKTISEIGKSVDMPGMQNLQKINDTNKH